MSAHVAPPPRPNGIELDVIDAGTPGDPVVMLVHGFPESSHSWRHQVEPLVAAGTGCWCPTSAGTASRAHLARSRRTGPTTCAPTELFRAMSGDRFFYILYFQTVGPAEAELEADVAETMRLTLWGGSGEMFGPPPDPLPPMEGTGFLQSITRGAAVPDGLPEWIDADEFAVYVEQFTASGFFGPLSWYRNFDADFAITNDLPAPTMPTAFIGGSKDGVIAGRPESVEAMAMMLPGFRGTIMIDGAGHWTQQEKPAEFNAALLDLLARIS